MSLYHTPVLLDESISALIGSPDGIYMDATFGGGGHSSEILSRLSDKGRLIAFDRDADALSNCGKEIREDGRLIFVQDNFRFIGNYAKWHLHLQRAANGATEDEAGRAADGATEDEAGRAADGATEDEAGRAAGSTTDSPAQRAGVDGILADLGVSSHQFDTPERGFSFRFDAPLDMRMDQQKQGQTAADIVNSYSEEALATVLDLYGEVQGSRKMASLIVKARSERKIETTTQLNEAIAPMLPKFAEHKLLAKVYQSLRIEVNGEMRALEKFLYGAADALREGGRLVVITYHSLEDRMVKNFIKAGNITGLAQKDMYGNTDTPFEAVNRKPILPEETEIAANTRARSAKLRVATKKARNTTSPKTRN